MLNTVGFICSWVGYALVSMHQRQKYGIKFYQPHTWIGMFTMVIYTINWFMGAILYTNLKCVPGYIKVYSEIDLDPTILKVLNLALI